MRNHPPSRQGTNNRFTTEARRSQRKFRCASTYTAPLLCRTGSLARRSPGDGGLRAILSSPRPPCLRGGSLFFGILARLPTPMQIRPWWPAFAGHDMARDEPSEPLVSFTAPRRGSWVAGSRPAMERVSDFNTGGNVTGYQCGCPSIRILQRRAHWQAILCIRRVRRGCRARRRAARSSSRARCGKGCRRDL